jgi:hypothetical protein
MRTLERRTGRRTQTTLLNHPSNYPDVERHEIDPKGNAMDRFKEPLNRSLDRVSLEEYDFQFTTRYTSDHFCVRGMIVLTHTIA